MIAPPYGWVRGNPPAMVCTYCGSFYGEALHRAGCRTSALESTVEAMARALEKALPGFAELHGQGIGCLDCPDDDYVERPHPDGPAVCPAYRQIEAALASWRALEGSK